MDILPAASVLRPSQWRTSNRRNSLWQVRVGVLKKKRDPWHVYIKMHHYGNHFQLVSIKVHGKLVSFTYIDFISNPPLPTQPFHLWTWWESQFAAKTKTRWYEHVILHVGHWLTLGSKKHGRPLPCWTSMLWFGGFTASGFPRSPHFWSCMIVRCI